jgi:ATP-dependent RNA helicase DeaD
MQQNKFGDLGLNNALLTAITTLGFIEPTPVQQQAIPAALGTNSDILALAQTGTGKTAAFGLPILQLLKTDVKSIQSLIVCPTRELCMQIERDLKQYAANTPGVSILAVYGGASITNQIKDLKRKPQIVVATPGRLMDLMDRKVADLKEVKYVVLDEADEMLNMGFREDIEHILSFTPKDKRVFLFSATMPADVRRIADRYLDSPVEITVGKKNTTNVNITHEYAVVAARDKYAALKRILDLHHNEFYGIVFCTTKIETQEISDHLIKDGYTADCIHGDLSQSQREKVMHRFRHKSVKVLLATDVAARGIDVKDLTHVVHYHLPEEIENYTHRSGRTARAGKTGISVTLLNIREAFKIKQIERLANIKFERVQIPTYQEVADKKVKSIIDKLLKDKISIVGFEKQIADNMPQFLALEKEEIVQRFLINELQKLNLGNSDANDLNVADRGAVENSPAAGTRLFINLGSKDGLNGGSMKELLINVGGLSFTDIERIDVKGVYSFVNVRDEKVEQIMTTIHGGEYKGRPVRVEKTGGESDRPARSFSDGGGERQGGFRGRSSGGGSRGSGGNAYKGGERKKYGGGDRDSGFRGGDRDRGGDRGNSGGDRGNSGGSSGGSSGPRKRTFGGDRDRRR